MVPCPVCLCEGCEHTDGVYGGMDDESGLVWRGIMFANDIHKRHKICSSVSSVGRASVS